jgi:putative membrane protein
MKSIIRSFLINLASLWLVTQLLGGFNLAHGYETLAVAAAVLGIFNLLVRPILNILFLPLNLITLGTFRWIINVATLYLVTLAVPGFSIGLFSFPGFTYNGFNLPSFTASGFPALILISFVLSIFSSFFYWLIK